MKYKERNDVLSQMSVNFVRNLEIKKNFCLRSSVMQLVQIRAANNYDLRLDADVVDFQA